ncbi:MAG: MFS transporter [Bacillota bacterium]|nr:MFS transporter [Bacillota bacterium]
MTGDFTLKAADERSTNKLWTRDYILAWFTALFIYISFDSMIPVLPLYIEIREGVSGGAGLPLASLTLGALLIRPFAGWAVDKYGRRNIFWLGLVLFLLPVLIYILMVPAYLLIGLRFIQGIGFGVSTTALFTVVSDIMPRSRFGEGMGYFTATMSLTPAIGPAVSSWLLEKYSYEYAFIFAAVFVIAAFIIALLIKYPYFERKVKAQRAALLSKTGLKPSLVMMLVSMTMSSTMTFLPVYAAIEGVAFMGIYYTVMAITSLILRPLSGKLVDQKGDRGYSIAVIVGVVAFTVSLLILARMSSLIDLVVGGLFFGIGFAFLQPTMISLTVKNVPPDKRGAANATYWTAFDLGIFLGSVIWGLVVTVVGYRAMFHLNLIPLGLVLVVYFVLSHLFNTEPESE